MKKYAWVKIIDVLGNKYEYENCEMKIFSGNVEVSFKAPLGSVRVFFMKRNIISLTYLEREEVGTIRITEDE